MTSAGTTRWRCRHCGASHTKRRQDITTAKWFRLFIDHCTGKASIAELAQSIGVGTATVHRKMKDYWLIRVPPTHRPPRIYDQIFLNGTYTASGCLLIASTPTHIIAWYWCRKETTANYTRLIENLAPPLMAVIDGGQGAYSAIKTHWPTPPSSSAAPSTPPASSAATPPTGHAPMRAKPSTASR